MSVLGLCAIIGGICVLFLPETGNKPLKDDVQEDGNKNEISPNTIEDRDINVHI